MSNCEGRKMASRLQRLISISSSGSDSSKMAKLPSITLASPSSLLFAAGLVTNSTSRGLLRGSQGGCPCPPPPYLEQQKQVRFQLNEQSRFTSVVLDDVLGPPCLAQNTRFSVVPKATQSSWGSLCPSMLFEFGNYHMESFRNPRDTWTLAQRSQDTVKNNWRNPWF